MFLKYSNNTTNNPSDLLSPHYDNFISCFGENFLSALEVRGVREFIYYDKEINKNFFIKIEDYFLQSTENSDNISTAIISDELDYFQSYDLFVNIKVSTEKNNSFISKWIHVGQIPKMQERGGFIRNGVKRVLLHQLIRSPGLYLDVQLSPNSNTMNFVKNTYLTHRKSSGRVIPEYGTWLKIESAAKGPRRSLSRADALPTKTRDRVYCTTEIFEKTPFVLLLCGLGIAPTVLHNVCSIGSYNNLRNLEIWQDEIYENRLGDLPNPWSRQQILGALWSTIKPFKRRRVPRTPEAVENLLKDSLYNKTSYNLGIRGRRQFFEQLGLNESLECTAPHLTPSDLCLLANRVIDLRWDSSIQPESGSLTYSLTNPESLKNRILRTPGEFLLNCIISELNNLNKRDSRFFKRGTKLVNTFQRKKDKKPIQNWDKITVNHYIQQITDNNFIDSRQLLNSFESFGNSKNKKKANYIENLPFQYQFDNQLKFHVLKRFSSLLHDGLTQSAQTFLNAIQISQLEDTLNPVSDLTLKRRVSVLGPDGINRAQASITMRNIHPTTYGRLCPIETPEGQNAGLVRSLAMHAVASKSGQIEVPFIDFDSINNQTFIKYTDSFTDKSFTFGLPDILTAQKDSPTPAPALVKQGSFFNKAFLWDCSFFGLTPIQFLSVGTTLTPFLEHDDATRVLMGSNMQRQSLPLIKCERPFVGTGSEILIGLDSRYVKCSNSSGIICGLNLNSIFILDVHYKSYLCNFIKSPSLFSYLNLYNVNKQKKSLFRYFPFPKSKQFVNEYKLPGPKRSNKSTVSFPLPIINMGDWVKRGTILAEETGLEKGQLALGCNLRVAYMPWDGFNFEDAIVFSESTALSEKMKTFHIKRFDFMTTAQQQITADFTGIPGSITSVHHHLDKDGLVIPGSFVRQGDAFVGVVGPNPSPKGWKIRLLKKLTKIDPSIPDINFDLLDQSFCVPVGMAGRVIAIQKRQTIENTTIRIYMLITRFLRIGDKLSGRHGNKGVISSLVSSQDLPYRPDGQQVDLILNPLGVPSRMNLGQIFECLLGLAGQQLQQRYKITAFDEIFAFGASKKLCYSKLYESRILSNNKAFFDTRHPGKTWMVDGRFGTGFDQPIVFGVIYVLKLCHQVEEKLHGRSTGEYSLVTQQPVQGRARGGGQRVGEMEVWAFQGYGASYMLQELLSIKSDDVEGRKEAAKTLLRGGVIYANKFQSYRKPQTLQILSYELKALCMDFRLSSL